MLSFLLLFLLVKTLEWDTDITKILQVLVYLHFIFFLVCISFPYLWHSFWILQKLKYWTSQVKCSFCNLSFNSSNIIILKKGDGGVDLEYIPIQFDEPFDVQWYWEILILRGSYLIVSFDQKQLSWNQKLGQMTEDKLTITYCFSASRSLSVASLKNAGVDEPWSTPAKTKNNPPSNYIL